MKANTTDTLNPGTQVSIKLNNMSKHLIGLVGYVDSLGIHVYLNDTDRYGEAVSQSAFFPWGSVTYITTEVSVRNESYGQPETWWTTFSAFGRVTSFLNSSGQKFDTVSHERASVTKEAQELYAKFVKSNDILGGIH